MKNYLKKMEKFFHSKLDLTINLEDSNNRTNIGHNELQCFIIAYNKNKPDEKL